MSLQDQTLNHTPHISDAKWIQKRKENSTRGQNVEKDTWHEVATVILKKRVIKKCKLIAEWEDEELFKSWQEKTSLQDQTLSHTLHISDAKLSRK